jgi:hypothetical protein
MRQKLILLSVLAVVGVMVLAVASVTAYALSAGYQDEGVTTSDQVKVAPIQAEPVVAPQAAPVRYQKSSGGCNHSVKMEMTNKPVEETSSDQLLTQAR